MRTNSTIPSQSARGRKRREKERRLDNFLSVERAGGKCEICGRYVGERRLSGAHIDRRNYTGSNDTIFNKIMTFGWCHDHSKYAHGLPISKEEARQIVEHRNREYNIVEMAECMLGAWAVGIAE